MLMSMNMVESEMSRLADFGTGSIEKALPMVLGGLNASMTKGP